MGKFPEDLDKYNSDNEIGYLFKLWKKHFKKEYQSPGEEAQRFQAFKSKVKYVKGKNAERELPSSCTFGLNEFSDLSYEEFSKIYLMDPKYFLDDLSDPDALAHDIFQYKGLCPYAAWRSCPDAPSRSCPDAPSRSCPDAPLSCTIC